MSDSTQFPEWIADAVRQQGSSLKPSSRDFFHKAMELFPNFDAAFLSIPPKSTIGVLRDHDPAVVQAHYGLESPTNFVLLSVCELFHFQTTYQLREIGLSLLSALREGRFYVAALTTRSFFEVVCVSYYTFHRTEASFKRCVKHLDDAARTKSAQERRRNLRKGEERKRKRKGKGNRL